MQDAVYITESLIEEMGECATTVIISIYMFPNYYIFFALLIYAGWAVLASCIYTLLFANFWVIYLCAFVS